MVVTADIHGRARRTTEMCVAQVMSTDIVTCDPATPVAEAASRMRGANSSSIVIADGAGVQGIWTEHDALRHDLNTPAAFEAPIREFMSAPVATITADSTLAEAATRFQQQKFRHFLVTDPDGRARGIVSRTDIVVNHGVEWFMRLRSASSVISEPPLTGVPEMTLSDAARAMGEARAEAIVVHDGEVRGILTERDIVRFIAERMHDRRAAEVASKPLATVCETDSLFQARNIMLERGFRHIGVVNENDELIGLIGFGDILDSIEQGYIEELETALGEREAALRESEERYRALVEQSPDAIAVHRAGHILFANEACMRLFGCDSGDRIIGRRIGEMLCPDPETDATESARNRLQILDSTPPSSPAHERMLRFDGRIIDVEVAAMAISYDGTPASQLVIRDISRRKQMENELRRLAITDQLTGAFNRMHFESHLEQMIRNARRLDAPFSLLMLDIDHFKVVNDAWGHDVGDQALCRLVEVISGILRTTDILARWGGEEFTVLAPATAIEGARELADKIRVAVSEAAFPPTEGLTVSIGLGEYRPDDTRMSLFLRVDRATYAAKDEGRNRIRVAD